MALNNTLHDRITPLCSHLFKLGFDMFGKQSAANQAFSLDNIDEDQLRNIARCENKRLHRFANEFPHEQHLLNLQSILVALLTKLAQHLNNQTTSVAEFQRELSRIVVVINEIDVERAKAKRRKQCAIEGNTDATRHAEDMLKIAADKDYAAVEKNKDKNHHYYQEYARQQVEAKNAKALKRENHIKMQAERALKALHASRSANLTQFRLHIKNALKKKFKVRLKGIIEEMTTDHETQQTILTERLSRYRFSRK